jgi:signal transduction histidine kinase
VKPKLRRAWQLAQEYWFDVLVFGGLAWWLIDIAVYIHGPDGEHGPLWFDVLAVLFFTLPFLARRRYPAAVLVVAGAAIGISSFIDVNLVKHPFVSFLFGLVITFRFGMLPNRVTSVAGLAFTVSIAALVEINDPTHGSGGSFAWDAITFTIAWIIGFAVGEKFREVDLAKERAERAEREREERARRAVADERARIARELHDVVGHSVSVMTVQASAVRRRLDDDQGQVREALEVVERTGREALAEMRRMVGVLRHPEEAPALAPQPSLEQLERLVEHTREAGLPVELRIEGDPVPLPAGIDLTAYRLVQEGLTNAIKHAGAKQAEVLVRYAVGQVELTVSDDGSGKGDGDGGGHGLVGMRERVSVYGGDLEAGPRPEGGFRLRAILPVA